MTSTVRGVARNLIKYAKGEQKRRSGDGNPPAGSKGRVPVGGWG